MSVFQDEVDRENPIFDGVSSVQIIASNMESHTKTLTVRVLNGKKQDPNGKSVDKVHIEIAEETSNPYFYYLLEVTEQDFYTLKREQSLLVDFGSFSTKFIELLALCKSNESFSVTLNLHSEPILNILERNQFRNLSHLSLRLQTPTDTLLKQYLASRLKQTLVHNRKLSNRLSTTQSCLGTTQSELLTLKESHIAFQKQSKETLEKVSKDLKKTYEEETRNQLSSSSDLLEKTKDELTSLHKRTKEEFNARESSWKKQVEDLQEKDLSQIQKIALLESQVNSLDDRIKNFSENERKEATETSTLRNLKLQLENEVENLKVENNRLRSENQTLSEKLKASEISLSTTVVEADKMKERLKGTENKMQHYRKNYKNYQRKLDISIKEINRGNGFIEQLQTEIKGSKLRIKNKNIVIKQQEKHVEELTSEREQYLTQKAKFEKKEDDDKVKIQHLTNKVNKLEEELEVAKETLESNQNVISYLNRQLNKGLPVTSSTDEYGKRLISDDIGDSRLDAKRFSSLSSKQEQDKVIEGVEKAFDQMEIEKLDFDKSLKELLVEEDISLSMDDIDEQQLNKLLTS